MWSDDYDKEICTGWVYVCAEFRAANQLLLANENLTFEEISWTNPTLARTGEFVETCDNCASMGLFGTNQ